MCATSHSRYGGVARDSSGEAQVMTRQETLRPLYCDLPGSQHLTTKCCTYGISESKQITGRIFGWPEITVVHESG